jgi:hypothetical protein
MRMKAPANRQANGGEGHEPQQIAKLKTHALKTPVATLFSSDLCAFRYFALFCSLEQLAGQRSCCLCKVAYRPSLLDAEHRINRRLKINGSHGGANHFGENFRPLQIERL